MVLFGILGGSKFVDQILILRINKTTKNVTLFQYNAKSFGTSKCPVCVQSGRQNDKCYKSCFKIQNGKRKSCRRCRYQQEQRLNVSPRFTCESNGLKLLQELNFSSLNRDRAPLSSHKSDVFRKQLRSPAKVPKDDHGPVREQMKNVITFKTADMEKFEPAKGTEKSPEKTDEQK